MLYEVITFPERYINELILATKYSDDIALKDRIEVEKTRISYRLGDDWGINQYYVENDT